MFGKGAKAYLPATAELFKVGMIEVETMMTMPALPLAKAFVASPAFQDIELGSTILNLVAQSNQNCTACTASGVFSWAVLRSLEIKSLPSCLAKVHQIFQGS